MDLIVKVHLFHSSSQLFCEQIVKSITVSFSKLFVFLLQLSVVESNRDQGLYDLYRELASAKALLTKLDDAAHG